VVPCLTNPIIPSVIVLATTNQSIPFGTTAITLAGTVSASGPIYPAQGEMIGVTINGNLQMSTINDSTGDFSFNYNPSTIPASTTPYTITYFYPGDASLSAATNTSTTLTVTQASPFVYIVVALTNGNLTLNPNYLLATNVYYYQGELSTDLVHWTIFTSPTSTFPIIINLQSNINQGIPYQFYRLIETNGLGP
jgi:hypothetical protein